MRHAGLIRILLSVGVIYIGIIDGLMPLARAELPSPQKPGTAEIQKLIADLCQTDDAVHRAAAERLQAMPEAIPALRKAVASTDLTLHWRADPVLREVLFQKNRQMAHGYPVDVFLERLLRVTDPYEEDAYWRVAAEFAGRIVDREKKEFKTGFKYNEMMPVYDFRKYYEKYPRNPIGPKQPLTDRDEVCVTRRELVVFPDHMEHVSSLITSPGLIKANRIHGSVILGGNSTNVHGTTQSIVVSDGDVISTEHIRFSIVITRGSVHSRRDIENSLVLAGGTVKFGTNKQNQVGRNVNSTIRDRDPKLLGWVRFFETAEAGVEVTVDAGGVEVAKLIDGLPPVKAGLKVGDVITAVDGKPAKDPETFRRLLRRGTVMDQTVFAVKRSGKDVAVTVSFRGWEPPVLKPAK